MVLFFLYIQFLHILLKIIHGAFPRRKILCQKPRERSHIRVAGGTRVTSVRAITAEVVLDITDLLPKQRYSSEKELISDLCLKITATKGGKLVFELDTAGGTTRIYKPGEHHSMLGISAHRNTTKRVVRKAYIESHAFLGCGRMDVTQRVDQCAGPQNDFFAGVGGLITPCDVMNTCRTCYWSTLHIEWTDGRPRSSFRLRDNDVITVPGKRYPKVDPFTVPMSVKPSKSILKKFMSIL